MVLGTLMQANIPSRILFEKKKRQDPEFTGNQSKVSRWLEIEFTGVPFAPERCHALSTNINTHSKMK